MSILDKLPKIPFLSSNSQDSEYFFAVNISSHEVVAAVWGIEGKRLQIVNSTKAKYSPEQELIEAANQALDEALADFLPEPTKVLFGVPDHWLQDDNLKPEHLKFLREMVKELELTPMAYVSSTHAITHLLQKQQGVPTTAVLVEVDDPLEVAVVKGGKVLGVKKQPRSANLPDDIEKALITFSGVEVLPSRILIYGADTKDFSKFKDELSSYAWMNQLPFLHLPKVEALEEDIQIKAICFAGATELNPDVHFAAGSIIASSVTANSLTKTINEQLTAEELHELGVQPADEETALTTTHRSLTDQPAVTHQKVPVKVGGFLAPLTHFLSEAGPSGHLTRTLRKIFGRGLVVPVALVLVLVGLLIFLPKATVKIFIDMQVMEKETQVVADPSLKEADEANKKIPGQIVETEVEGTAKIATTGKKKVGEQAKGKVIIYNATSKSLSLNKGTTLTNDSNLKFVLDSNVQIASKSASAADPPSKSSPTDALASEIGPEGNIAAGGELIVSGFSKAEVVAKVDSAFSGGVSKDVTIVTAEDQRKLLAQLTSELKQKASQELQAKQTGDLKVLEESFAEQILKQNYTKKVDEQASELGLTLRLRLKGTAYSEANLKSIVSKLVSTNVPEGFELDLAQSETQATVSKIEKDGKLIFTAKFRAKLKPKLDTGKLKKELAGKTADQAAAKLKEINNVIGSEIEVNPSLPGPLKRLPFLAKNITIEVTAK